MANTDDTLDMLPLIKCNSNNNTIEECCKRNASSIEFGPQTSSACLQKRRALRNYQNSVKEIKEKRKIATSKNSSLDGKETLVYNKSGYQTIYIEYKRTPTTKFFKKYSKVDGCMRCFGNFQIPAKYTLEEYLYIKIKEKAVTQYRLKDYKPNQDLVEYNKYQFINGLWQFKGVEKRNINYCFEGC
jgi:hypothetical protein